MKYIFDSCLLKKRMHYFYTCFLEIFFFFFFDILNLYFIIKWIIFDLGSSIFFAIIGIIQQNEVEMTDINIDDILIKYSFLLRS